MSKTSTKSMIILSDHDVAAAFDRMITELIERTSRIVEKHMPRTRKPSRRQLAKTA